MTNLSIKERLEEAETKITEAQQKRIQLETRLESAEERKAKILAECKEKGIDPDQLESSIKALDKKITHGLEEIESILQDTPDNDTTSDEDLPF